MKKLSLIIILNFITLTIFGQVAKGDRILAWQVDMAENVNYDSAFAYAQAGCMESIHLTFAWNHIEPNAGNFDMNYINNTLDVANIYYPATGTMVELQIPTMNTNVKVTPTDLISTNFDDLTMINRFKILLDTLFTHIPNVELTALNIGNESDIYMGIDGLQYTQYKVFLDSVVPYAKQLYFNLHGTNLKVGTTFTFDGLTAAATSSLCQSVNNGLDIVSTTYYPLNSDFTMEPPTVVSNDFGDLVNVYPNPLQPIYFVECGYASSDSCNSSNALQADFFENVFIAWDTYYDNIKYLTIFKSTDWSQQTVDDLGQFYGISDNIFLEYLRTLGVRTWDNNGTDKPAYHTILCELNVRNWCAVDCNSLNITPTLKNQNLSVYPNPTNGILHIDTDQQVTTINVYNNTGKLILVSSKQLIEIDHLENGIYFLSIQLENGSIIQRKVLKE